MALPAIGGLVTSIWTALQPFLPIIATKAAEEAGKQIPAAIGRLWASSDHAEASVAFMEKRDPDFRGEE